MRRVIAGVGRSFVAIGVLLLLFVAYQLWGTGIATARAQRDLKGDLDTLGIDRALIHNVEDVFAAPSGPWTRPAPPSSITAATGLPGADNPVVIPGPATTLPVAGAPTPTTVFRSRRPPIPVKPGEAIGVIKIPKIGVNKAFVTGTSTEQLKKGPGHYESTPFPGREGNVAIAGHRTTYGAPFYRMDELKAGDPIYIVTPEGQFKYETERLYIVKPNDTTVLSPTPGESILTLTTCHPRFSAARRLILRARLVGQVPSGEILEAVNAGVPPSTVPPSSAPTSSAPTSAAPTSSAPTSTVPTSTVPTSSAPPSSAPTSTARPSSVGQSGVGGSTIGAQDEDGYSLWWFSGPPRVWTNTAIWAALCGAIWLLAWVMAHRRRGLFTRVGIYFAFLVPFTFSLYFTYESLARLLPENI